MIISLVLSKNAGGHEAGGADEGGEEGAVDGLPPGPRLGQERPMSWPLASEILPRKQNYTIVIFC